MEHIAMKKYVLSLIRGLKFFALCSLLSALIGCATGGDIFPPAVKPVGVYHQVKTKETLWRIAKTYGVSMESVVRVNRLPDATKINTGQFLFIPGVRETREVTKNDEFWKDKGDFAWPLKGKVTSLYGAQKYNLTNKGIDIQGNSGESIIASRNGKVAFCDQDIKGQGGVIVVEHGDGFSTVYGHSLEILVEPGQLVKSGMVIARMKNTNQASLPHLHFEIRKGHIPQNPFHYLP